MVVEVLVLEKEDSFDAIVGGVSCSREGDHLDAIGTVFKFKHEDKGLKPLLSIVSVHFDDPGSGLDLATRKSNVARV